MPTAAAAAPHRTGRVPLLVALLALVLAACGGGSSDPAEQLAEAFQGTFEDSFAYRFVVDADQAAMDGLGEGAGQAAAFLSGFAVAGVVDEDAMSFDVQALGSALLQVRAIGEEELYARLGVQDLLGLMGGGFAPEDLVPALETLGFDQEMQGIVLSALSGEWIGIEGGFDAARFGGLTGEDASVDPDEAETAFKDAFGDDLPAFFERFVVVQGEPDETDGTETFAVALQLRELLRAASSMSEEVGAAEGMSLEDLEADLADLPETVPGEVSVRDGVVTEIAFRAAETIRESGTEVTGDLDLVLELSDHGDVEAISAPEGATTITSDQLAEMLEKLAGFAGQGLGGFGLEG